MLVLTVADVKNGIKYGVGIDEFCTKYNCTTEEFERRIRGMFHSKAESILGEIRASERKHRKDRSRFKSGKMKGGSMVPMSTFVAAEPEETEKDTSDAAPATQCDFELLPLEELRIEEKRVGDLAVANEIKYQTLLTQHKEKLGHLREIQKELIEIEDSFKRKSDEYRLVVTEDNELTEKINAISESYRSNMISLGTIRDRIKVLETVTLYAYDDGSITIIDGPQMEFDDTGADEYFPQLVTRPECENLTVRQVKLIAKVLCVVKNAEGPTAVLFDSESVDKAYQSISTTIS